MFAFRYIFFTLIIVFLLNNFSNAQTGFMQIKGIVMDNSNHSPLGHATVYLSNTTIGTTTLADGTFALSNIPGGKYDLIISYVGFETQALRIDKQSNDIILKIQMKRNIARLKEITVNAGKFNKTYFSWFKRYFLGTDENASDCEIKNPRTLYFNFNKQTGLFTANAKEPIIIINKALGYKIYYDLQYFYFNFKTRHLIYFGYPRFEVLHAKNKRIQKEWKKNRLRTYVGSMHHFMQSLISENLEKEGFEVHKLVRIKDPSFDTTYTILYSDKLSYDSMISVAKDKPGYAKLNFTNSLYISYTPPATLGISPVIHVPVSSYAIETKPRYPPSILTLTKPTYIDSNGHLTNPMAVTKKNGWANRQVADLLPINYAIP